MKTGTALKRLVRKLAYLEEPTKEERPTAEELRERHPINYDKAVAKLQKKKSRVTVVLEREA